MLASYNWLKDLVTAGAAAAGHGGHGAKPFALSPKDVAAKFTNAGIEVESSREYGAPKECVVARVASIRPHPSKSGLRLVTVETGTGSQEVVCGAPNVPDAGGLVVLAPLGAHLPAKNMTIARREIAGVASEGMLCSESELGLSEAAEGIIVLDHGSPGQHHGRPGQPFVELFPRDEIFEIGLTPNRPDALGHIGLARELAALCEIAWRAPLVVEVESKEPIDSLGVKITIEDGARCPIYAAASAVNVTVAPSPAWVRYRLEALGVRAISNIVDVTNLVMLETGHPMHAFDLDRMHSAHIIVRRAKTGESLKTLDGVARALDADDLLICEGHTPVALAGVMGGADSEIGNATKRVLFECAYFDARGVRRVSKRHGLHTESSHRFERGVDWDDYAYVLARAVSLTREIAHGAHGLGGHIVARGDHIARKSITLRHARMNALLGVDVPMAEALATLTRLGCVVTKSSADEAELVAPSHRPDLAREVDLFDEVIRVRGIDSVPTVLPAVKATRDVGGAEALSTRVRNEAVALGLSEAVTYAFTTRESLEKLRAPVASVALKNPLSELQSVMRTSVLAGLVDVLSSARRHGEKNARTFTIGSTYESRGRDLPTETLRFAALLAGDAPTYLEKPRAVDVWDAIGVAEELVHAVTGARCEIKREPTSFAHLHPRGAAGIYLHNARIGQLGPLHPDVMDAFELDGAVLVIELDMLPLSKAETPRCVALPRFPANTRDMALVVSDDILAGDVVKTVKKVAGELAEDVVLFDRFTGNTIPPDHASLAFHVIYRHKDKTLTDAEVDAAHATVVREVNARFGATLR